MGELFAPYHSQLFKVCVLLRECFPHSLQISPSTLAPLFYRVKKTPELWCLAIDRVTMIVVGHEVAQFAVLIALQRGVLHFVQLDSRIDVGFATPGFAVFLRNI